MQILGITQKTFPPLVTPCIMIILKFDILLTLLCAFYVCYPKGVIIYIIIGNANTWHYPQKGSSFGYTHFRAYINYFFVCY